MFCLVFSNGERIVDAPYLVTRSPYFEELNRFRASSPETMELKRYTTKMWDDFVEGDINDDNLHMVDHLDLDPTGIINLLIQKSITDEDIINRLSSLSLEDLQRYLKLLTYGD